jgi:hypothetical protein
VQVQQLLKTTGRQLQAAATAAGKQQRKGGTSDTAAAGDVGVTEDACISSCSGRQTQTDVGAAACTSLDIRLQPALLCHPTIGQDQQMVAQLQQTSQEMQAAVAELCAARLPVVLHTKMLQQAQGFAQWLSKHAGLVQSLELQLNFRRADMIARSGTAMAALEPVLQAALAAGSMQLQTMSITGSTIGASTIERMPAASLTSLRIEVNCHCPSTMQALATLTGLRHLHLTNTAPTPAQAPMWSPPVAAEVEALAP